MFGYVYAIIYTKCSENVVSNLFSRKFEEEASLFAVSLLVQILIKEACQEWIVNDSIVQLI